jgi:hypothetical protein
VRQREAEFEQDGILDGGSRKQNAIGKGKLPWEAQSRDYGDSDGDSHVHRNHSVVGMTGRRASRPIINRKVFLE